MELFLINFFLNSVDAVNYYITFSKITQYKKPITRLFFLFFLLWGLVMATVLLLFPAENFLDIYRILNQCALFLIIHIFYNHKRNLHDTAIIFGMQNVWLLFLNLCLLKVSIYLPYHNSKYFYIFAQCILFCLTLLTMFLPLHKLYHLTRQNVVVELPFYFLTIIYLIYCLKTKFNYQLLIAQADEMIFIMIIFIILFWNRLHYYDKKIKMHAESEKIVQTTVDGLLKRVHKFENVLSSINGSLAIANDLDEHRRTVKEYTHIVEFDSDMRKIITADNKYVIAFIHAKQQQARELGVDIVTDITYRNKCNFIPDHIIMVDLLGELLDNAVQYSEKGTTIQVRLQVDTQKMHLEVENQHKWIDDIEKKKIFQTGYSTNHNTKSKRGYGISNVVDAIKDYHGTIKLINSYDKDDNKVIIFEVAIPS